MPHKEKGEVRVLGQVPSLFDFGRDVTYWLCCGESVLISTGCMFVFLQTEEGHCGINIVDAVVQLCQ